MKTVIIDDEYANIEVLTCQLQRHCQNIELAGSAQDVAEGYQLIQATKPDLVFLDVCMVDKTGFDLLRMFDDLDFQVIFVTGHDEYALLAFDFCVLDYLLKPVDTERLVRAVARAEKGLKKDDTRKVMDFIDSVDEQSSQLKKITLHKNEKVVLLPVDQISYVEACGNYCHVVSSMNERFLCSKTLLSYEKLLSTNPFFIRISKKCLLNVNFIRGYTKGTDCYITLSDNSQFEVSRRKKGEVLQLLKQQVGIMRC